MRNLWKIGVFFLILALLGGGFVYAVGSYGSQSDPLITLSYLNQVLRPAMEQEFAAETEQALEEIRQTAEKDGENGYVPVTLAAGETMTCGVGCEFLVRSGSAYLSGGFVNVTAGSEAEAGAWLAAHNLYLAGVEGAAVTATGETSLMARGSYTIE